MKGRYKKVIVGAAATVGATACGLMASGVAGAQGLSEVELLGTQVNLMFVILGAILVIFMQAGFALVETGFCRAKHAANVMSTNFAIFGIGFVAFFLIGFPLMFGGYSLPLIGFDEPVGKALIGSGDWVFLWQGGWGGSGKAFYTAGGMGFFLYMVAFMDTVATIPTGAMAERWKWNAFVGWGFFCGAIYYPIFGAWTWGGGWLAKLGNTMDWGVGYADFAGSGVVHAVGGVAGLAGAIVLGPRIGKFNSDGSANTLAAHHIPMAQLGTFILLFGWFGFNAASTFAATDVRFAVVATNTALAAAFGAVSAMFLMQARTGKPDPGMMVNGMLGGLVIVTAPCAFIQPWAAAVIGIMGGIIVPFVAEFIEKKGIDDPVGAVAVHGVGGTIGVLAVGIFADGQYGAGWNGTTTTTDGVTGLLYGGDGPGQFMSQLAGVVIIWTVIFGLAYGFFYLQNKLMKGGIRPTAEMELEGMDMPEMGALAYADFHLHEDIVTGHGGGSPTEEELV
jgi:Amt family ammonium transporter